LTKNYCIGIFFTSFLSCLAQEDSIRVRYFKPFNDNITTRLSVNSSSNSFVLTDVANNKVYDIVPNDRERIDLSVSYRSIAFSFGFALDFLATNKDNSDSKLYNLNFRAFHKQWTQSFDLYSQRGFYLEANDVKVPLPEMKTFKIGGQTSYILNKNFSFRAISAQSEWQQKAPEVWFRRCLFITRNCVSELKILTKQHTFTPQHYRRLIFIILSSGKIFLFH